MPKSNGTEKKYNQTLGGLWETKTGNLMSMKVDARMLDAIQGVRLGSKLFIKYLPEDRRKEKSPHAYFEVVSPEDVAEFEANNKGRPYTQGGSTENETPNTPDSFL